MEGAIILSVRDQLKIDLIVKVESGVMDRETVQHALDVSQRTLRRYIRDYRRYGTIFVLHKNRGKSPGNKTPETLRLKCMTLMRTRYYDFNMLHALEKINQDLDTTIKREIFRKWCHKEGMVKRHRKRRARPRKYRVRMKQVGQLIQMDGSHHRWFAGIETCLIVAIDDASGEILFAQFSYEESTKACLSVLHETVLKKGCFKLLYVDKAGVFGGVKRSGFSQVERALGELGTHVMYAHSPQAKGRVERVFDTLQDRLIPEMRLAGIKNLRQANKYLQEIYIPQLHNPKFSFKSESPMTAFTPVPGYLDLSQVFCKKEYRKVAKDHTISIEGVRYMLNRKFEHSISGHKIEIRTYKDSSWLAFYGGEKLRLIKINKVEKRVA
jgi:transposase